MTNVMLQEHELDYPLSDHDSIVSLTEIYPNLNVVNVIHKSLDVDKFQDLV